MQGLPNLKSSGANSQAYNNGSSGGNRPPQKFVGAANNPYVNKNKYSSGAGAGGIGGGLGS